MDERRIAEGVSPDPRAPPPVDALALPRPVLAVILFLSHGRGGRPTGGGIGRYMIRWSVKRLFTQLLALCLVPFICACRKEKELDRDKYPRADESALKGVVRTNLDSPDPTRAQMDRKARSIALITEMGLPYINHLPVVEDEQEIVARTPEEVAKRCLAVALCAVKGVSRGADQADLESLVEEYHARPYFSPKETAFMYDVAPSQQDLIDFAWGYECNHVLLWALGHIDELNPPNEICDASRDAGLIRDAGPTRFIEEARLRGQAEILDMADYYYRLHWAAIELRLNGQHSDEVNEEIVRERHRALNWLIRYMGQEWDDVTTDT
jgi:hypothetical protein